MVLIPVFIITVKNKDIDVILTTTIQLQTKNKQEQQKTTKHNTDSSNITNSTPPTTTNNLKTHTKNIMKISQSQSVGRPPPPSSNPFLGYGNRIGGRTERDLEYQASYDLSRNL